MHKAKYIKTCTKQIIIFSDYQAHDTFKLFRPLSAGFIKFGVDLSGGVICWCYGESVSLNLKSEEEDTKLAMYQILGKNS